MNSILQKNLVKICTVLMLMLSFNSWSQAHIAAWTFNSINPAPSTGVSFASNEGSQSGIAYLHADGTVGSSVWTTAVSGNELTSFAGTTLNDPRAMPAASQALGFLGGTSNSADGKSIVLSFSMIGNIDPILSYAMYGTADSFDSMQWAWSVDGMTYTDFGGSAVTNNATYNVQTLNMSAVEDLDNAQTAYLRLTFNGGSSSASESTRIDNIVITSTQLEPPTQISLAQCNTTLPSMNTSIYATNFNNSTGHRFEIKNMTTNEVEILERDPRWFKMSMLENFEYSTTYLMRVEREVDGVWAGYYGYSCEISTPDVTGPNGAAQVVEAQCGASLAALNTNIFSNNIPYSTGYRFRITNMSNPLAPNQVQVIDRPLRWFNLTMLATYNYGTTYQIEVAVKTTGDYSEFGNPCTVTTLPAPPMLKCAETVTNENTIVGTSSYNYTTAYMFELTDTSDNTVLTIVRPIQWFRFSMIPDYVPGNEYSIRVALMTSGSYSPFGPACLFVAPGGDDDTRTSPNLNPDFKAVLSPNPYVSNFGVEFETKSELPISVIVYDMIGNVVESKNVTAAEISSQEFGKGYRQGVYNVIIKQGDTLKTLRVIKR